MFQPRISYQLPMKSPPWIGIRIMVKKNRWTKSLPPLVAALSPESCCLFSDLFSFPLYEDLCPRSRSPLAFLWSALSEDLAAPIFLSCFRQRTFLRKMKKPSVKLWATASSASEFPSFLPSLSSSSQMSTFYSSGSRAVLSVSAWYFTHTGNIIIKNNAIGRGCLIKQWFFKYPRLNCPKFVSPGHTSEYSDFSRKKF